MPLPFILAFPKPTMPAIFLDSWRCSWVKRTNSLQVELMNSPGLSKQKNINNTPKAAVNWPTRIMETATDKVTSIGTGVRNSSGHRRFQVRHSLHNTGTPEKAWCT
ncbi:unnamed protein product [Polarella glacialis]|uniref:Uncharacterized protein n=1 Tax=Polarella glacialis TaxID=89957 RepID=A0A813FKK0_POLGL|nr:unnamed protein product [Polarella glacialis]